MCIYAYICAYLLALCTYIYTYFQNIINVTDCNIINLCQSIELGDEVCCKGRSWTTSHPNGERQISKRIHEKGWACRWWLRQADGEAKAKTKFTICVFQLEISQLTTERDQLVRQLEKSQDMLLSFQQVALLLFWNTRSFFKRPFRCLDSSVCGGG